jgi:hypothetical protein
LQGLTGQFQEDILKIGRTQALIAERERISYRFLPQVFGECLSLVGVKEQNIFDPLKGF